MCLRWRVGCCSATASQPWPRLRRATRRPSIHHSNGRPGRRPPGCSVPCGPCSMGVMGLAVVDLTRTSTATQSHRGGVGTVPGAACTERTLVVDLFQMASWRVGGIRHRRPLDLPGRHRIHISACARSRCDAARAISRVGDLRVGTHCRGVATQSECTVSCSPQHRDPLPMNRFFENRQCSATIVRRDR